MRLQQKTKRMRIVAANGILILIPCALLLKAWAVAGDFGPMFFVVQGVEFVAGLANLTLLGMNMRDGLNLRRERDRRHIATNDIGAAADFR